MSSSDSTRKTPRWPPESAGLSTAGNPTSSAARRRLGERAHRGEARLRHARVGEPRAASRPCASSGAPSRRRSPAGRAPRRPPRRPARRGRRETVSTPSSCSRAVAFSTAATSAKSTTFAMSASCEPGRVGVAVDGDDAQARAPSPAGSRGAGGGRRRRRERSSHGAMLLARDERVVERREERVADPAVLVRRRLVEVRVISA